MYRHPWIEFFCSGKIAAQRSESLQSQSQAQSQPIDTIAIGFPSPAPAPPAPISTSAHIQQTPTRIWPTLVPTLSSFPHLTQIVVGLSSREDMLDFAATTATATAGATMIMGRLSVKYALWDPDGYNSMGYRGTWVRASPGFDGVECMLFSVSFYWAA